MLATQLNIHIRTIALTQWPDNDAGRAETTPLANDHCQPTFPVPTRYFVVKYFSGTPCHVGKSLCLMQIVAAFIL